MYMAAGVRIQFGPFRDRLLCVDEAHPTNRRPGSTLPSPADALALPRPPAPPPHTLYYYFKKKRTSLLKP